MARATLTFLKLVADESSFRRRAEPRCFQACFPNRTPKGNAVADFSNEKWGKLFINRRQHTCRE